MTARCVRRSPACPARRDRPWSGCRACTTRSRPGSPPQAGAQAVCLSGATVSAVDLGLPDFGFVHGTDIARRAAALLPVAGRGAAAGRRRHRLRQRAAGPADHPGLRRAGIAGLHLEDQVAPKRCGHLGGKEVVGVDEAASRIRAAVEADTGLVIVARTDALSVLGRDAVVERCRAFAAAGADAVFVEGAGIDDLEAVVGRLGGRRSPAAPDVQPLRGWRARSTPGPTTSGWPQAGVRLVIHPVSAMLAAAEAVRRTMTAIVGTGHAGAVDRMAWTDLTDLVGLPELLAGRIEVRRACGGRGVVGRTQMSEVRTESVIVAGAGAVGLTAALVVARAGVQVTVLEAGDGLATESRASTFHPPSLEMLDDLGVLEP